MGSAGGNDDNYSCCGNEGIFETKNGASQIVNINITVQVLPHTRSMRQFCSFCKERRYCSWYFDRMIKDV